MIEALDRYWREHNANVHRGVHTLSEEATALYEGARRDARPPHRRRPARGRLRPQRDRGAQPGRVLLGPRERRRGRPHRGHRDGAPLQHRPLVPARPGAGRRPRLGADHRRGPARPGRLRDAARARAEARLRRARLERARHDQPDRRDRADGPRRRRAAGRRRRAGRAEAASSTWPSLAPTSTRSPRHKMYGPTGHRRALRAPRAARGDAAVHRRRLDDPQGATRPDHLGRPAGEVRGRHPADRRGDRLRRGRRAGSTSSASPAVHAAEAELDRVRARAPGGGAGPAGLRPAGRR